VLFESGHLAHAERNACVTFMEARGYRLMYEGRDCLAMHDSVRQRWPQTAFQFDAYAPER
jgi:hypothetical protein